MKYLSKNEYECVHCGEKHNNEFSVTCADCDYRRESEGLGIGDEQ